MAFVLTGQINLRPPQNLDSIKKQIENKFRNLSVMPLDSIPTVTGQVKKLNTEITKTVFISKQIDSSFASVGSNLGKTVRRFGAFTVATTALFGIIRSFEANIKNAVLFEKELLKISQVTGTSVKGLSSLKNEITNLSTGLGVGSTKLLSVARVLAQAGLAANDVRVSLEAIAKSDLAPTFDSVEQTTEGVVAVMRQFKKEAKDVEAVLGSINAVAGKFAVESADLIQFIRGAGGTFEAAGGSVEELFGLGTSIRATTRESAASIATGLRTIFARLQRTRTQNFLEDFNIQLRLTREEAVKLGRTEGEFVGPFEAIKRLSIALQQIPSTDPRFAQIIEELGGFRQINKVIPLIKQNALAQQAYNVALQGTNSLNKDAEKALDSLSNKLDRLSEKFIEISRILLENEGVKQLINQVLTLSNVILDSVKSLSDFANVLAFLPITSLLGARPFITGFQGISRNYIERNNGGSVPGTGNKDTIPAMLTPGEFVLKKQAVASIGLSRLIAMNATGKIPGFNKGGLVGGVNFDTIQQVQLGGGVFALANILGTVNKDFNVLQNSIQTASTTFVALSLVSSALRKDYTSSINEISESILKAKSDIKTLSSVDEISGRESVYDTSGKKHYVVKESISEIENFKLANSMQKKLIDGLNKEGDIQKDLLNRKKQAIKLAEEERDAIKNIVAFREAQTGKLFKSESVDRVRNKLDAALPTVDLSLLNNSATASSAKSLLNVDPGLISSAVSKTIDESLLGNLLNNTSFSSIDKSFGGAFSAPQFKTRNTDQVLKDFASGQLSGKKASEIFSGTQFATTFNKLIKNLGVDEARNTVSRSLDRRKNALFSNDPNVRNVLSSFASGGSGKGAISALAGSDAQKSLRSLIRQSGVDNARQIVGDYLKTESTIASSQDLQDIFFSLEGKTAEEQKKFLNNLGSFIRTTELTPENAIINKAGNIITQQQAQELRDQPFLERTKDKTKFLTDEEKILVEQNKKRKKTLEYISSEEGAKAEEEKIDKKRKEVKKRILERESYILTLTNQQSVLNNDITKLRSKQRDAIAAGDIQGANNLQSRINRMIASGTTGQDRINSLTSQQDQDFAILSRLGKNQSTIREVVARAKIIEENSLENQLKTKKKFIEEEEAKIAAMQRAQNALNNFSIGINVLSSGLIALGQYLDKEARSRLESFRKGFGSSEGLASQSATASATGAFGTGMAIGGQLGGPIGASLSPLLGPAAPLGPLLGMLGGAAIGGVANASVAYATTLSEVENEIESILRNRTIDRFEKALINASQNSSLALSDRGFVNRGSSIALQDILTLQGDSNREDLFGRLENLRNPLQEFINRVSTSVKSIDDFNKVVGEDTVELFLLLNSIPIEKFNEEIQKNISISNKSRKINESLIKSNQELVYRINLQRNLVSVVSDSIFALDKGFNSLNSTISGIDGSFRSNINLTGVDRLSKINNIIDFSSFQLDVTKLGNIFGESGSLISKNSIAAANAIKVLPNVLLDINSRSNLEGTGEFTQKLDSQLSSLGVAEEIRKIIISQVDSIIGPEAKDQNIIEKLNSDFEGTVSQITKGISSLSDPLREAGSLFETKFNEIGDLLDQRIEIESKIQQSFLKTIDVYEQSERILASTFNRDVNLKKLLGFENQTQRFILGPNSGLANDPSGIFDRLQTVQEDLREAQYRLSNSTSLTAEEMIALRDQISVSKYEVSGLTGSLEFMADVTKRTSILQESLNKQQRERETKFGFAETLAFGSQKEIRQLLSTIQLTNTAIGAGSLEGFSAEQKKEIQGLLNKVGDTALFAGGLTGNKARDLLVGNNLKRIGANPDGIVGPGQEEKNIQNKIAEAVLRGQEAQEALYLNLQGQNQSFNQELAAIFDIFISDLSNTLSRTTVQNIQGDLARKEVERNREIEKLNSAREVQNAFGLDVNALLPIIETLKQFESTGNIVSRLQGRQALSGAGGLGLSALKGVNTEEVVIGGDRGFTAKANFVSTDQSKVLLKSLRNTLLEQIGDENIVAQIISETSKSVLPSAISQRGNRELISVGGLLSGVDKVIKQIEESRVKDLELLKSDREDALGLLDKDQERAVVISKNLIRASGNIENLAKDLGEAFNFDQTNTRIKELNKQIEILGATINKINNGNPRGFSSGGLVGGAGNRDSISARLTPGEFVLNRKAVEKIGISNLNRLNRSNSRSTTQSSSTNSVSTTNSMEIAQESLAQLNRAMQTFAFNVQKLEKAFSSFPTEITITGRHFVEVVINGAQVLQNIKPEISTMIESEIKNSINKMLRSKFPDKGQVI